MDQQQDERGSARQRWDELVDSARKLGQHLWTEATNRHDPAWPPNWLKFTASAVIVLLVGFVVLPLLTALLGTFAGWTSDGVDWLAAWDMAKVVSDPVRLYLNNHADPLPAEPDVLWVAWLAAGVALLALSTIGSTGARIGWVLFGAGSAAMVWSQTLRPGEWLAVGITAAWWTALSLVAYRRRAARDQYLVLPSLPSPRRPTGSGVGSRRGEDDLAEAMLILEDLARLLDLAEQSAMDTHDSTLPPDTIRHHAGRVRVLRRRLEALVEEEAASPN